MKFNALNYRYPSRRSVIYGIKGMVCTSQPLAAQAGLDIFKKGGNAIDAMLATAICMTVLEPSGNGIGSDTFALVWSAKDKKLYGLMSIEMRYFAFRSVLIFVLISFIAFEYIFLLPGKHLIRS